MLNVCVFVLSVELWWNATSTKQFSSTWSKHANVSHGFFPSVYFTVSETCICNLFFLTFTENDTIVKEVEFSRPLKCSQT